ncbi:hypothetical protein J2X46_002108 [Nocardioides sp. BE266]|uniref:hypothetical protein n=1 Tax=Nocardioides sp. BE266 TaxID=2817725 RepID=UPI002864F060|nr:hypothetical protein [Nocardioides sp. BE266]MDR7253123.1 hypothetical protein [Nocardioides sp. BE266]
MMSPGVVAAVLLAVLVVGAVAYVALRMMGAREVEGDHPGEKGYVPTSRDHD